MGWSSRENSYRDRLGAEVVEIYKRFPEDSKFLKNENCVQGIFAFEDGVTVISRKGETGRGGEGEGEEEEEKELRKEGIFYIEENHLFAIESSGRTKIMLFSTPSLDSRDNKVIEVKKKKE